MEHTLSIQFEIGAIISNFVTLKADIPSLGQPPIIYPKTVSGKLLDIKPEFMKLLQTRHNLLVTLSGGAYKFQALRNDGTFELQQDYGADLGNRA